MLTVLFQQKDISFSSVLAGFKDNSNNLAFINSIKCSRRCSRTSTIRRRW